MNHPNALNLDGVPRKLTAHDVAWEALSNFRFHQRKTPGLVGVVRDLDVMQAVIEDVRIEIVKEMREDGCSWAEIGELFGLTRQGARQRYGGRGIA